MPPCFRYRVAGEVGLGAELVVKGLTESMNLKEEDFDDVIKTLNPKTTVLDDPDTSAITHYIHKMVFCRFGRNAPPLICIH